MTSHAFRAPALAAIFAIATFGAAAQTAALDHNHEGSSFAQAGSNDQPGETVGQGRGEYSDQPCVMPPGRMGPGMMRQGMGPQGTGAPGRPGGPMRGHGPNVFMKVMFAIADVDGDGALSFEEVSAIHRRIFNKIDVNKDGRITLEEIQEFFRD